MTRHANAAASAVVYRHYDADGALLYIGFTQDLDDRWRNHGGEAWRRHVARTEVQCYATRRAAMRAERAAIATEGPLFNNQDGTARRYPARGYAYLVGRVP